MTSITALNDSIGYAAGGAGLILKITNGNNINGIEALNENIQLNIFPNPTTDEITIDSFLSSEKYLVSIENSLGESILQSRYTLPTKINVQTLNSGIFILRVVSKQGKLYSKKFIKL